MRKFHALFKVESTDKQTGPEKQSECPGASRAGFEVELGPTSYLVCVLGQVTELSFLQPLFAHLKNGGNAELL